MSCAKRRKIHLSDHQLSGICWFSAGVPCHKAFLSQESLYYQTQQRTIKGKSQIIAIHLPCLIPPKKRNRMTPKWWIHTIAKILKSYFPMGTASRYDLGPCNHHLFGQSGTSMENKFAGRGGARLTRHRASSTNSWSRQTHNMHETQPAKPMFSRGCTAHPDVGNIPQMEGTGMGFVTPQKKLKSFYILHFGTWGFVKPMVKRGGGSNPKNPANLRGCFLLWGRFPLKTNMWFLHHHMPSGWQSLWKRLDCRRRHVQLVCLMQSQTKKKSKHFRFSIKTYIFQTP